MKRTLVRKRSGDLSQRKQAQHVRRYESGKVTVVNRGVSKARPRIRAAVRRDRSDSVPIPVKKLKVSPRKPEKEITKKVLVFERWSKEKMLAMILRHMTEHHHQDIPCLGIYLEYDKGAWHISLGLGWQIGLDDADKSDIMAKIGIETNDASTTAELMMGLAKDLYARTDGMIDPVIFIKRGQEDKLREFIKASKTIPDSYIGQLSKLQQTSSGNSLVMRVGHDFIMGENDY